MNLRHVLLRSKVGRHVGPYHRRLPFALRPLARPLEHYVAACRQSVGARQVAEKWLDMMEAGARDGQGPDRIAATIEHSYGTDHYTVGVQGTPALVACGRLCISAIATLAKPKRPVFVAPLLRRVVANGFGLESGSTNSQLESWVPDLVVKLEIYVREARSRPSGLDAISPSLRPVVSGWLIGHTMSANFLSQKLAGIRLPQPRDDVAEMFGTWIMFDPRDDPAKRAQLPPIPEL